MIFGLVLIGFGGCAQKISIQKLTLSQVQDKAIKNITIGEITNDKVALASMITQDIQTLKIENKPFFTLIARGESLNQVLNEQKIQDLGLTKTTQISPIEPAHAIVTGAIQSQRKNKIFFNKQEINYNNCIKPDPSNQKKCLTFETKNIRCQKNSYTLSALLEITKVQNGSVLFSQLFNENHQDTFCHPQIDNSDEHEIFFDMAHTISKKFLQKIAPSYVDIEVEILDDLDIKVDTNIQVEFKVALQLIDQKQYDLAIFELEKINTKLPIKSAVVLYDLAILYEAIADYEKASLLLEEAKNLSKDNDILELCAQGLSRLQSTQKTTQQLHKTFFTQ